jgi:hypothetical protein
MHCVIASPHTLTEFRAIMHSVIATPHMLTEFRAIMHSVIASPHTLTEFRAIMHYVIASPHTLTEFRAIMHYVIDSPHTLTEFRAIMRCVIASPHTLTEFRNEACVWEARGTVCPDLQAFYMQIRGHEIEYVDVHRSVTFVTVTKKRESLLCIYNSRAVTWSGTAYRIRSNSLNFKQNSPACTYVGSKVVAEIIMKTALSWDTALYSPTSSNLKMEAIYSSKIPTEFQRTTRRCTPEDRSLH